MAAAYSKDGIPTLETVEVIAKGGFSLGDLGWTFDDPRVQAEVTKHNLMVSEQDAQDALSTFGIASAQYEATYENY